MPYPTELDTRKKRRGWLKQRGWYEVSNDGSGCWFSPWRPGDGVFYTLAAALIQEWGDIPWQKPRTTPKRPEGLPDWAVKVIRPSFD